MKGGKQAGRVKHVQAVREGEGDEGSEGKVKGAHLPSMRASGIKACAQRSRS